MENGDLSRLQRLRSAGKYIVTGVKVYGQGTVEVIRIADSREPGENRKRGIVKHFSRASRERLAFVSRETSYTFGSLMTLTYGKQFPVNGKDVKRHLNRFLVWYRRYVWGEYIWWLEFQKRGAPHIHLASQKEEVTGYDLVEFAKRWAAAQGLKLGLHYTDLRTGEERDLYTDVVKVHSHRSQWEPVKKAGGAKRYIVKYALKMRQKTVPVNYQNVGRFWGCSKGVSGSIPEPREVKISEGELRDKLANCDHMAADWECLPKNLWGVAREFDKDP